MQLPNEIIFNELNGLEGKEILIKRFSDLLDKVPFLQRHLTLPRVKMITSVTFEFYADTPYPERQSIDDTVVLKSTSGVPNSPATPSGPVPARDGSAPDYLPPSYPGPPLNVYQPLVLTDSVDASPNGSPPDQIRDEHSIPITVPVRGPIATEDRLVSTPIPGLDIKRGYSKELGRSGTVVTQDFGPTRDRTVGSLEFKNSPGPDRERFNK